MSSSEVMLEGNMDKFNGLGMHLGNAWRLSDAISRTITPENFTGQKGGACRATEGTGAKASAELGLGWKVSPMVRVESGEIFTLADIEGPGAIQHIWMTITGNWRHSIIRIYWDDQEQPSVECPIGHFFCAGWNCFSQVSALPINVNPGKAFNSYWEMPFKKHCRITIENINKFVVPIYYQIDYTLTEVPEYSAYFHAQFRRENSVQYAIPYTILDGVKGEGNYVGTYMALSPKSGAWWGEGEVKFYFDGDKEFPTITSTGLEDYFCGAYDFMTNKQYTPFTNLYCGLPQVILPDGRYQSETRLGLYRFHITDPIRFKKSLKVTAQDLGWNSDGTRYAARQDDISTCAYWYQTLPTAPFPKLPSWQELDIALEPHPQG